MSLLTSAVAREHLGAPLNHPDAEAAAGGTPGSTPGSFVIATSSDATVVGTVGLDRRDAERPGQLVDRGQALEVSYVLDPARWGQGYATEAVSAVLSWASGVLADPHVVACTQTTNGPSIALLQRLGFTEIDRFVEFDAEQGQWLRALDPTEAPSPLTLGP